MSRRSRLAALLVAAAAVAGCSATLPGGDAAPPAPGASASAPVSGVPSPDAADWQADLDALLPALQTVHPDLVHGAPPALAAAVAALRAEAPGLNDDQLMVGVVRIMARIAPGGDGHTGLYVWSPGNRPVHSLPLRWWSFRDGLVVEAVLGGDRAMIGARVASIAGTPIADVERRVDALVPRETASTQPLLRPRFLLIPEVLRGLGFVADPKAPVRLEFVTQSGRQRTVDIPPVPIERYNRWAGPYGLGLVARPGLRFLTHPDAVLWHEVLPSQRALYVGFGRVEPLDPAELAAVTAAARDPGIRRIVVDVRTNTGGEVDAGRPLLDALTDPAVVRHARLYLLTGRATFSAAALFAAQLRAAAPTVVIGEPAASGAVSYGNAREVRLPRTGLVLSVASTREAAGGTGGAADVDRPLAMSSAEWLAGRDPVLSAALTGRQ
jgi:hypothetical protein